MSRARLSAASLRARAGLADACVYPRLRSTNLRAAELLAQGRLKLPAAVVASLQTAGRGRGSNAWYADAGSLAFTMLLPVEEGNAPAQLPLRAGLAVRAVLARYVSADRLRVKWPNDLLADGRKLAGILCERVRGADLIGVGVNVTTDLSRAPADVRRHATTLARLTRRKPALAGVLAELASALRGVWQLDQWCEEINRVHALTGRRIAVDTGEVVIRGACTGVDAQGRLLVDDGRRLHRILSGSIL